MADQKPSAEEKNFFGLPSRLILVVMLVMCLIFGGFIASLAYSVMQIRPEIGEVEMRFENDRFVVTLPINISNGGIYDIKDFTISTRVYDGTDLLANATTHVDSIKAQGETPISHTMIFDVPSFLTSHPIYLFNDTELQMEDYIGLNLAGAIPVSITINNSLPWQAPMANFNCIQSSPEPVNATHFKVSNNIRFENHSPLYLEGKITLKAYSSETLVATANADMSCNSGSTYEGKLDFTVPYGQQVTRIVLTIQSQQFTVEVPVYG
jgi:hypothetical protein